MDYIAHNWLQGKVRKAVIKPGSGPDNKKRPNKHRGEKRKLDQLWGKKSEKVSEKGIVGFCFF